MSRSFIHQQNAISRTAGIKPKIAGKAREFGKIFQLFRYGAVIRGDLTLGTSWGTFCISRLCNALQRSRGNSAQSFNFTGT
jgi:hypothetical protein